MRGADGYLALAVAGVCLSLYVSTMAPGLCFPAGDSHEITLNAARLGVTHPSGYPVYTWLASLFMHALPFGEPAWRINLMSAVLGAAAVGMLYLVGRRLGMPRFVAAATALLFGVSRTFWSQALIAEVYTSDVLAIVVTLWLLLRWADQVTVQRAPAQGRFVAFAFVFGVSLGTHLSNLAYAPAYALFVLLTDRHILRRPREIGVAFAVFALGVLQYAWLPLRGGRFDLYPNPAPDTLAGFWAYTGGAFENLRFAFPLSALPQRLTLFLQFLGENLTIPGAVLGLVGTWALLRWDAARFWLLAGILVANVVIFSQFGVPDPEVFFLPSWIVWALFAGVGGWALWHVLAGSRVGRGVVATVVIVGLAIQVWRGVPVNDRRHDTAVSDFDRNVMAMLPPESVLVTPRGAFGADMPYWRDVLHLRPDVSLPSQGESSGEAGPRFTTVTLADGRPTPAGLSGQSPSVLPAVGWYVPVLLGARLGQVLARVAVEPPTMIERGSTEPGSDVGGVTFAGAEVALRADAPCPRMRLRSRWRLPAPAPVVVSTRVGGETIESHELGFGNLDRYAAEAGWPSDGTVIEDVDVVVPSWLAPGRHAVQLGVTVYGATGFETRWMDAGAVVVP